ncbi:MAG: 2,3-bisphosphoglycerate-independent phosphoglycerate mutase, partial [Candidatus Bathyarchaeota archaeon]
MKLIYVVIDGLGDLPVEELGHRTPLDVADTPNMDHLAKRGKTGMMYTVGKGIAPESDVAVISILGYDPFKYATGRGVLEAVGIGVNVKDGDLALRCNFATLGAGNEIIDRRVGRDLSTVEAGELSKAINKQVGLRAHAASFEFRNTIGYRGVLVIHSKTGALSSAITNTDPAYHRTKQFSVAEEAVEMTPRPCEPLDQTEAAQISAELVNEFTGKSHVILEGHTINRRRVAEGRLKANTILMRDAGHQLPRFFKIGKRYNVEFVSLVDMPVERGISTLAGMHPIDLPQPSQDFEEDCRLRAERLLDLLPAYDCFYIHIKGPDEPAHDGNAKRKTRLIALIDEYLIGPLLKDAPMENTVICVTADHSTPCRLKAHSDDPVPIVISGGKVDADDVTKFCESACMKGSLGLLPQGVELMPILI